MPALRHRSLPLPPVPESAPSARACARTTLRDWSMGGDMVDCSHPADQRAGHQCVAARRDAGHRASRSRRPHTLRIEVDDAADARPQPRHADLLAEGGRGLELVAMLASRWGVDGRPGGGKRVWFELAY